VASGERLSLNIHITCGHYLLLIAKSNMLFAVCRNKRFLFPAAIGQKSHKRIREQSDKIGTTVADCRAISDPPHVNFARGIINGV